MTFTLQPRGPFSLAAAAAFAEWFPGTRADRPTGELRFSWAVDDDWRTVTATLRERGEAVDVELDGASEPVLADRARRDVERILCLDVDGSGFVEVGERDPVIGKLQHRFDGLRPVLFSTPYEAAAWTIVGHRIRITQAATVKQRLADEHGEHRAFPGPERLATLTAPPRGLTERKLEQLHALAAAARDGKLTRDRLRAMDPDEATRELQRLPGIGPFSAELVLIRGVGDPDALPQHEQRLARAIRSAYDLPDDAPIEPIADAWRPYRAWSALLLRAWLEAETQEIATGRPAPTRAGPPVA